MAGVGRGSAHRSPLAPERDGRIVALLVLVSVLPYVHRLGFSSDDFSFVASMALAEDTSPLSLVRDLSDEEGLRNRPTQVLLNVGLFTLFGNAPLGYHIVGASLLVGATVLFHRALSEAGAPRPVAVLLPLVWAMSPAYATNRFWFAAFGYTLAMAAFFLSVWAELRAVRGERLAWGWKAVAIAALVVGAMGPEVVIPLLLAVPLVLPWYVRRRHGRGLLAVHGRAGLGALTCNVVVLAAAVAFKAVTAEGAGTGSDLFRHLRRLLLTASVPQLGSFGALLPDSVRWALAHAPAAVVATALALGAGATLVARSTLATEPPGRRTWWLLVAGGMAVFSLAWSLFLTTGRFTLTSTGIGTRVGVAAALGSSSMLLGGAGLVSSMIRHRAARAWAGGILVGALCGSYALLTLTVGDHWVQARHSTDTIVDAVAATVAGDRGATVLLSGVCPYNGPAIVFENGWDLEGALRLRLGDHALRADVVTPRLELSPEGIRTSIYGHITEQYDYAPDTLLVEHPSGRTTPLVDHATAIEALDASGFDPVRDCPPGREGNGVDQLRLDDNFDDARF